MSPLAIDFHELVEELRARQSADTRRLHRPASAFQRELPELPAGTRPSTSCSLCGDPSAAQVCDRCTTHLETTGGLL